MNKNIFNFNNEFNNTIMENRPVFVFDYNTDNKQGILISYLLYLDIDTLQEKISKYVSLEDISNDSIILFDKRHIIELAQMYYGYFRIITFNNNDELCKSCTEKIIKKLYLPIKFKDLYSYMDAICLDYTKYDTNVIKDKIQLINKTIWFIPYSKIDELILEAVDIYEKENKKEGDNNE